MSQTRSNSIATGAMMTAISLIAITLAFFVKNMSITFNMITVIILLFLYSAGMKKAMILCYIATSILALILFNFYGGMAYVLFYGAYTLIACFTSKLSKKLKPLVYIGKIIYINGVVAIILFVAKSIISPQIVEYVTKNALNYICVCVVVSVLVLVYDYILIKIIPHVFNYLNKYLKIKRRKNTENTDDVNMNGSANNGDKDIRSPFDGKTDSQNNLPKNPEEKKDGVDNDSDIWSKKSENKSDDEEK